MHYGEFLCSCPTKHCCKSMQHQKSYRIKKLLPENVPSSLCLPSSAILLRFFAVYLLEKYLQQINYLLCMAEIRTATSNTFASKCSTSSCRLPKAPKAPKNNGIQQQKGKSLFLFYFVLADLCSTSSCMTKRLPKITESNSRKEFKELSVLLCTYRIWSFFADIIVTTCKLQVQTLS